MCGSRCFSFIYILMLTMMTRNTITPPRITVTTVSSLKSDDNSTPNINNTPNSKTTGQRRSSSGSNDSNPKSPMQKLVKNLVSLASACGEAPLGISHQVAFLQDSIPVHPDYDDDYDHVNNRSLMMDSNHDDDINYGDYDDSSDWLEELPRYYSSGDDFNNWDWNDIIYKHNHNHNNPNDKQNHNDGDYRSASSNSNSSSNSIHHKIIELVMPKLDSKMQNGTVQWLMTANHNTFINNRNNSSSNNNKSSNKNRVSKASEVICMVHSHNHMANKSSNRTSMALDLGGCVDSKESPSKDGYYLVIQFVKDSEDADVNQILGLITSDASYIPIIVSYFKSIGNKKILQRNKEMEQQRLKELQEKEAELKAREEMDAVIEESNRILNEENGVTVTAADEDEDDVKERKDANDEIAKMEKMTLLEVENSMKNECVVHSKLMINDQRIIHAYAPDTKTLPQSHISTDDIMKISAPTSPTRAKFPPKLEHTFELLRRDAQKEYTRLITYQSFVVGGKFCWGSHCHQQPLLLNILRQPYCVICGGCGSGVDGAYNQFHENRTSHNAPISSTKTVELTSEKPSSVLKSDEMLAQEIGQRAISGWKLKPNSERCTKCGKSDVIMIKNSTVECARCNRI